MTKRVLIIDDDEDMLEIFNIIFEDEGYELILSNKEIPSDEIELLHPDLILLDVRIKGSSRTGDQICKEIKSINGIKSIPVILVSSEANVHLLANDAGANGYVRKPFDIDYMISKVNRMLV